MKNSMYYYGATADKWFDLPYKKALKAKIKYGKKHLSNLIKLEEYYRELKATDINTFNKLEEITDYNPINLVTTWIDDVMGAISFNNTLLKELDSNHKLLYGEISDVFLEDLKQIKGNK